MTAVVIAQAVLDTPKRPREGEVLRVWLQEFAWTEADIPRKRRERASSLPPDSEAARHVDAQPLWCFEVRGDGVCL